MEFSFHDEGVTTALDYGELNISSEEDQGFRPFQLMVASIVSCSGFVFKRVLAKKRLNVDEITAHVSIERNKDEANRLEKLNITFKVKGEGLDQEQLEKSLTLASKHCPMVRSVEESIEINETVEIV